MTPHNTCLGRLGSRFSLQLDPIRREVLYGAVGLFHQLRGELLIELRDDSGLTAALPLAGDRPGFELLNQRQTMTRVVYEAYHLAADTRLTVEFLAPFLPGDRRMSIAPLYLVHVTVARLERRLRWTGPHPDCARRGVLRFALSLPEADTSRDGELHTVRYSSTIRARRVSGEGGVSRELDPTARTAGAPVAHCLGQIAPLAGDWRMTEDGFELTYDTAGGVTEGWLALTGWFADPCFEAGHEAGPLRYVSEFGSPEAVLDYAGAERERMVATAEFLDGLITDSSLPKSLQDLIAFSFHSFLSCTLWAEVAGRDWFSVWEGSCWYNSTVDVEYNDAPAFFGFWPDLLELIFDQWTGHLTEAEAGAWLAHDMGEGWTANGQSYPHPMEVEENSNWLLLLHAHAVWWGRQELFERHAETNRRLVDYLLWSDSTGNGFPDRGTANTIDDATPAVQYGRDQVYLGVKRLAALHAARRMLEAAGDFDRARRCQQAVSTALETLDREGWLGDHYTVCLDRSTAGLRDAWNGQPLPYDELPGWDAYSLYTTNGLLYLMMVDDLPAGLEPERLRLDLVSAFRASLGEYGCSHSSADPDHLWVSMNLWRDQAAAYLHEDLLATADRYWAMQVAANAGTEAKCFVDTNYTNNLCFYPRGIASLGALWAAAGLRVRAAEKMLAFAPPAPCRVPILTHVDWARLRAPWLEARPTAEGVEWSVEHEDLLDGWSLVPMV